MTTANIFEILGIIGAAAILLAFFMNEADRWSRESLKYDVTNLCGSLMLLANAIYFGALPFAVLNFVWAIIAAKDLLFRKKQRDNS